MKDFNTWINESVLPTVQRALHALRDRKDQKDLVRRIQLADPYRDKRFAPVIANWVVNLDITPEEHSDEVKGFKALHRRLKGLRVPATNRERAARVKELLAKKPEDFALHYSDLQEWNREVSEILDPNKDLSDDGLPVEMRYNGYTMYRIDTEEHCEVPLVRNTMSWCVTKASFGEYGGVPYYPVVRDRDMKPFAMIIPSYFDTDPDQAVRNADNTGRLSPSDLELIRPLVQHALPLDRHKITAYINSIHQVKLKLPGNPSAEQAYLVMRDYVMEPGEWPEGERVISQDPEYALLYANHVLKGRFRAGEEAISQHPKWACGYAQFVIRAPWPKGEKAISQHPELACHYAEHLIKGPWPVGEPAIGRDPQYAFHYAQHVLKGPFPFGEEVISQSAYYSYRYARDVLRAPFPAGEQAISKDLRNRLLYKEFLKTLEKPTNLQKLSSEPRFSASRLPKAPG